MPFAAGARGKEEKPPSRNSWRNSGESREDHSIRTQATDRAYRIGQDKPVFVHKLLCQDTVEQRIHQMQQEKAKLAAGLLADADIYNKFDASMVRALLEE